MGNLIALIILVILGIGLTKELGIDFSGIYYFLADKISFFTNSGTTSTIIALVIGAVIVYFVFLKKE